MPYKRAGTTKWWITVSGVRQTSGTEDFEDAKALEAKLNHDAWKRDKMEMEPERAWKEAVVKYLGEHGHAASYDSMVSRMKWWDVHLGDIADIRKITRDSVDKIIQRHRKPTSQASPGNTTTNKYVIIVNAVLNAACREWGWTLSSPKLRRYPEPDHRRDFLTVEEWRKLEAQLPAHLLMPARFALATGLRASKVFGLEWAQIDRRAGSLKTIGNAVKRGVTIPLNKTALSVLDEISASPVRHMSRVFTYQGEPMENYGMAWKKAVERAGLGKITKTRSEDGKEHVAWQGFTWHGLRHTFASWLGQSGASDTVIDQLCGWAEKDTRSVYTHLDVNSLRPYCEAIDRALAADEAPAQKISQAV